MYRKRVLGVMGVLLILGLVCPVLAAEAGKSSSDQQNPAQSQAPSKMRDQMSTADQGAGQANLQKATKLIGMKVQNPRGEDLGTIHDIVLAPDRTSATYAVLAHGGVLGMGDKYFAIPWSALEYSTANRNLVLDVSKSDLDQAKGFDKNNWPEQGDMKWGRQGTVSGYMPPGESGSAAEKSSAQQEGGQKSEMNTANRRWTEMAPRDRMFSTRRVSKIIGMDVRNGQNEDLGTIEDVVINMQNRQGNLAYCIVAYGGMLGMGEKFVAVPWSAVTLRPGADFARLDATKQDVEAVAFTSDKYPDLADRDYARRISEHFKTQPYWEVYGFVAGEGGMVMFEAWRANSEFSRKFDPKNVTTMNGSVESVGTFTPARGASEGIRLRVKTDDGNMVTVLAGPKFYAEKENFAFQNGDKLKITGAKTEWNGRSVIFASEISKDGQTLKLRDSQGKPLWESAIPSQGQMQKRGGESKGESGGSMEPSDQGERTSPSGGDEMK